MLYTIEEIKRKLAGTASEVYDIFKNFFGEEAVDLQTGQDIQYSLRARNFPTTMQEDESLVYDISDEDLNALISDYRPYYWDIIVYWPHVVVTNENNRSIDIHDLYAKVTVQTNGTIPYEYHGFTLNRSRYTKEQFCHRNGGGYMHSHICHIPRHNLSAFQTPCLGRGPIRDTIQTLKNDYSEVSWMLFCQELSMYVTVESLAGVPYNKLEEVGNSRISYEYTNYHLSNVRDFVIYKKYIKDFAAYYLKHGNLKISYNHGEFTPGMSFFDFIIDISNSFISYYNQNQELKDQFSSFRLFDSGFLKKRMVSSKKFYINDVTSDDTDLSSYIGTHILFFKGKDIKLVIDESNEEFTPELAVVLDADIAMYILFNILLIINYRFKNEHTNRNTEEVTTAGKNVRYL